ncbi:MAG TPA: hypothetical protein VJB37_03250 [Patescibacteria group bacterium]|nr:hypothetical protein [Patescibacteria group bacterium]
MKKISLLIVLFPLLLLNTGCGWNNSNPEIPPTSLVDFTLSIQKSADNERLINVQAESPTTLGELLKKSQLDYGFGSKKGWQTLTHCDQVISTASKQWHIYINDQLASVPDLDQLVISNQDEIKITYEEKQ